MKILFVTPYVPSYIFTRPRNLIRSLHDLGHDLTVLAAAGRSPADLQHAEDLRELGIQVEVFPVPLGRSLLNCLLALPSREPLQAVFSYQPAMAKRLTHLVQAACFDVVHIEHLRASRLIHALPPGTKIPIVYDSVDSISLLFEQAAQISSQLKSRLMTAVDLGRTRRYEAYVQTQFDHIVVTSQRDKEALESLAQKYLNPTAKTAPITVVTNGVDLDFFTPDSSIQRDKHTVVFTGKMSYHANVTAVLVFVQQVLPLIWEKKPKARFQIVGKDPPEAIRQLATDSRIEVTGTVPDLRPYLAKATLAVCPTQYAVGIQNKVLEAMAMGTPVVSTAAGAAGLASQGQKSILVASSSQEVATLALRIFSQPTLAERLIENGRGYVEENHSWQVAAQKLTTIYQQATANPSSL